MCNLSFTPYIPTCKTLQLPVLGAYTGFGVVVKVQILAKMPVYIITSVRTKGQGFSQLMAKNSGSGWEYSLYPPLGISILLQDAALAHCSHAVHTVLSLHCSCNCIYSLSYCHFIFQPGRFVLLTQHKKT